jgi:amino acid adenylation domain-containing protein/thioester reductase-like protein
MSDEPVSDADQPRSTAPRTDEEELLALLMAEAGFNEDFTDTITPDTDTTIAQLSFAQQRLWFLDQLEPGSAAYNMPTAAIRLVGNLDVQRLSAALATIIRRHNSLRTTFAMVEGQPRQQIHPVDEDWQLPTVDLRHLPPEARENEVDRLVTTQASRPFDLSSGPLFRFSVVIVGETEHLLLITFHHIISDGWSLDIFFKELGALYSASVQEAAAPLPPLPIQYSDFAEWQHRQVESYEPQLEYWRHQLADTPPVLQLPTDRPRLKQSDVPPSNRHHFLIAPDLSAEIRALAHKNGVTLFMILLAAFKVLLFRYTRQIDICVGTNIANRTRTEVEGLIGFFANTLVLRSDLSGDQTFVELLQHVRRMAVEAYENQEVPFEQVVEALQPERDLTLTPFFQVMFVLQPATPQVVLPDVSVSVTHVDSGTAKFDLELEIVDAPSGLAGSIEYDTTLFNVETIERLATHFQTLLASITTSPKTAIARLPILSAAEKQQLLVTWNKTDRPFDLTRCYHHVFEDQVEKTPDAVAVSCEDIRLTYRELNNRANQVAHLLVEQGVGPEVVVALLAERGIEFLVMILAVLKAGGAYLPLDPRHPPHRHRQILSQSHFPLVLSTPEFMAVLDQAMAGDSANQRSPVLKMNGVLADDYPDQNLPSRVAPRNLAYVIFTSGSTGRPKGAMVEHRGMLNHLWSKVEDLRITADDIIAQNASQTFDISVWQFLVALMVGGQVRIFRDEVAFDPQRLFTEVGRHRLTILQVVPSLLKAILQTLEQYPERRPEMLHLRWVVPTGEALTTELAARWLRCYPGIPMLNAYGSTECSDDQCHHPLPAIPPDFQLPTIPIGKAMANVQIYILDDYLAPVPIGVPGELYVGGTGVGRGYLHDPVRTAAAFVPNPFSTVSDQRLYKTGDLGRYLPDGSIEFLGRVDFMVKIRGFRIELGEIEATLTRHPTIREAVVLARSGEQSSSAGDEKYLAAYIVPDGDVPETTVIRTFLKERLPDYMVPAAFVFMQSMPLTRNGKIDRKAFPEPKMEATRLAGEFQAPIGPIQEKLAEIWGKLLQTPQIGAHDNFFEIGGHSLLATQLIYQVRDGFEVDIPVRELFTSPTIAELAQVIEQMRLGHSHRLAVAIDFEAEAHLPQEIHPKGQPRDSVDGQKVGPAAVLLTGGTGFLGAFLLAELLQQTTATIYCLVRAEDRTTGALRLTEALNGYNLWRPDWANRIVPVLGDLAEPAFGLTDDGFLMLARTVDTIFHNAALVNFVYPYSALKAPNVDGTCEILRLATIERPIPLHYVSTVSVFDSLPYFEAGRVILETEEPGYPGGLMYGYAQTKWVAERMVLQARTRGLPVTIYRPGTVVGDSRTGHWNRGDYLGRFIAGCIQLGLAPDLDQTLWLSPVDFVGRAIIYLSQTIAGFDQYHVITPASIHLRQLFEILTELGYDVAVTSYKNWQAALQAGSETNALYPVLPLITEPVSPEEPRSLIELLEIEPEYSTVQFQAALTGSGITSPRLDHTVWQRYVASLLRK